MRLLGGGRSLRLSPLPALHPLWLCAAACCRGVDGPSGRGQGRARRQRGGHDATHQVEDAAAGAPQESHHRWAAGPAPVHGMGCLGPASTRAAHPAYPLLASGTQGPSWQPARATLETSACITTASRRPPRQASSRPRPWRRRRRPPAAMSPSWHRHSSAFHRRRRRPAEYESPLNLSDPVAVNSNMAYPPTRGPFTHVSFTHKMYVCM